MVEKPYHSLQAFIDNQENHRSLQTIAELPIESMRTFSGAACVQAPDLPTMRVALQRQLRTLPHNVREEIIDNSLIEGISVQSSVQNASVGIDKDGSSYAYLGFWSTEYIGAAALSAGPRYSTCIVATGIQLDVAEEVAAWETSQEPRLVGSQPCHCGFLYCERCPVLKQVINKRPIMKRHKLTLQNHINLHNWMIRLAIDKARVLISGRKKNSLTQWIPDTFSLGNPAHTIGIIHDDVWDAPRSDSFRDEQTMTNTKLEETNNSAQF